MKHTRCEEVIVQLVVRSYDEDGRPIREQVSQPTKVFRNAQTRDFWGEVDKAVKTMETTPAPQAVPPAPPQRGKRR